MMDAQAVAPVWNPRAELTSPALISLDYLAPPSAVEPYVTTFFHMRCDEPDIIDVQPASVGLFVVFLRGHGVMLTPDGNSHPSFQTSVITPLAAAAQVRVKGPWHAFGAAISPLGWAALTGGQSAAEWANRLVDAQDLLGPEVNALGQALVRGYEAGAMRPEEMVEQTSRLFARIAKHVPPQHVTIIRAVADWLGSSLSPRIEDLEARSAYSPRQLQRLVDRYYGLTPKPLARKYRATRAATLLSNPAIPPDQVAHVAEQFYDQSHMIREIRLFAGRTPARLTQPDQPMMSALLDLRTFREVRPKVAAMPPGLG